REGQRYELSTTALYPSLTDGGGRRLSHNDQRSAAFRQESAGDPWRSLFHYQSLRRTTLFGGHTGSICSSIRPRAATGKARIQHRATRPTSLLGQRAVSARSG